MPNTENDLLRAMLEGLFNESGLEISDDALDRVVALHRHFAANRARLVAGNFGELEPVTVFTVDEAQEGRDDD